VYKFARETVFPPYTKPSFSDPYPICLVKPNNLKQDFLLDHAVSLPERERNVIMKDLRQYAGDESSVLAAMVKASTLVGLYEEHGSYMICAIIRAIREEMTAKVVTCTVISGAPTSRVPSTLETSTAVTANRETSSGNVAAGLPPASGSRPTGRRTASHGTRTSKRLQEKQQRRRGSTSTTKTRDRGKSLLANAFAFQKMREKASRAPRRKKRSILTYDDSSSLPGNTASSGHNGTGSIVTPLLLDTIACEQMSNI
jgi:hypothetical protein